MSKLSTEHYADPRWLKKLIKVEIKNLDIDEWQWLGRLSEEKLRELCEIADRLSDESTPKEDIR